VHAGKKVSYPVVDGAQQLAERLARGVELLNGRELVEEESKSKEKMLCNLLGDGCYGTANCVAQSGRGAGREGSCGGFWNARSNER
jgi:hypothetical protein